MERQVANDHVNCDFVPSLRLAPDKDLQLEVSAAGKYRFIDSSGSVTMIEKTVAVKRWYNTAQHVTFCGFQDNGNRLNRYWVHTAFPRQHPRRSFDTNIILPPMLAYPGIYEAMAHVDIVSAYFSVLSLVGLHPNVIWGKTLGVGSRLDSYPFLDNKTVRNSLYGTAFNPRLHYLTRGKIKTVRPEKKVSNPHMVQVVQVVMHSIARYARNLGAVYWYTDGGILPKVKLDQFLTWVTCTFGLTVKVKSTGTMTVYNPGQYQTPNHEPRRAKRNIRAADTIDGWRGDYPYAGYENWLIDKLAHWVRQRGKPGIVLAENFVAV